MKQLSKSGVVLAKEVGLDLYNNYFHENNTAPLHVYYSPEVDELLVSANRPTRTRRKLILSIGGIEMFNLGEYWSYVGEL